ncbi:hypothetical protein [Burkholderia ubonensis]|uniref:hypothetical protein n=1 Tax=Burkholderia ubonensis TaxID=101571 RepID=UPI000A91DB74|nr:hypothetical protein [Burkholderia ubonensis]
MHFSNHFRAVCRGFFLVLLSIGSIAARAQTTLVIDQEGGPNQGPAVVQVDSTGKRTIRSDFTDSTQGPTGVQPKSIAPAPPGVLGLSNPGAVLVLDGSAGTPTTGRPVEAELFFVDATGKRNVLTDFGDASKGDIGQCPSSVEVASALLGLVNAILVVDPCAGSSGRGIVYSVDQQTGIRTPVSDLNNSSQGPLGGKIVAATVAPAGFLGLEPVLLLLDGLAGTSSLGAIYAVDLATGNRTRISDLGDSTKGPVTIAPNAILAMSGPLSACIYVLDTSGGSNYSGTVLKVDASDGNRTTITDFGNLSTGPLGADVDGLVAGADGYTLLVTDDDEDSGLYPNAAADLISVDLTNGKRTRVSNFSNSAQGPGGAPEGVVIVN